VIKSELIRALNEKLPELQVRDVELALNCILAQMADALVQGKRIEIRDLVVLIYIVGLPVLPAILKRVKRLIHRLK